MTISTISLMAAAVSAFIIAIDVWRNPQSMRIMNVVWILTALWSSIFGLIAYFWFGREEHTMAMDQMDMPHRAKWQSVALSTLHCGAGCTLADILGSIILLLIPMTLVSGWILTYILALVIGIYFQFIAIREMSHDSTPKILKRAIKADFWSLTTWQIGMYGWLALLIFHFQCLPATPSMNSNFWFAMQQAMGVGFILALPTNHLLIKSKIKEGM